MEEGEKFPPKACWISAKLPDPLSTKSMFVMVAFWEPWHQLVLCTGQPVYKPWNSTARNLCVICRQSLLRFRKCFWNNQYYISVRDNLLFLDVQHYFREEQGKDRPSYCYSCTGWRRRRRRSKSGRWRMKSSSPSSLDKWYSGFSTYVQSST